MVCRGSHAMHGHFLKRAQRYGLFRNKHTVMSTKIPIFQTKLVESSLRVLAALDLIKSKRCTTFVC